MASYLKINDDFTLPITGLKESIAPTGGPLNPPKKYSQLVTVIIDPKSINSTLMDTIVNYFNNNDNNISLQAFNNEILVWENDSDVILYDCVIDYITNNDAEMGSLQFLTNLS